MLCEEHNHSKLATVFKVLVELSELTISSHGEGEEEEGEKTPVLTTPQAQQALGKLDSAASVEGEGGREGRREGEGNRRREGEGNRRREGRGGRRKGSDREDM